MKRVLSFVALVCTLALATVSSAAVSAIPAGNVVKDPGAEEAFPDFDGNVVPIPSWQTSEGFTAATYGNDDFPSTHAAFEVGGGHNFFAGGPNTALSHARQTVDVAVAAPEIDGGKLSATLSAALGGWGQQSDNATVTARFLNASGAQLGTLRIGPVTAGERGGVTKLLKRSKTAFVPVGTRLVEIVLTATRVNGDYNDAYFDNISLELRRGDIVAPTAKALPAKGKAGAWVRMRYYMNDNSGVARARISIYNGSKLRIRRSGPFRKVKLDAVYSFQYRTGFVGSLRWCIRAIDRAGNRSPLSCAPLVLAG
jgi:hypothetical protein